MGTDSLSGYSAVLSALSGGDTAEIYTGSAETASGRTDIATALSAMNSNTCSHVHISALSITKRAECPNSLSGRTAGSVSLNNMLCQDSLSGTYTVSVPVGRTGISAKTLISLPMSTGRLNTDTLTVYADERDITIRLISAEIDLFGVPSFTAEFLAGTQIFRKMVFVINGEEFSFETTASQVSAEKTVLSGRMRTDSRLTPINIKAMKASALTLQFSSGIVWTAEDYVVSGLAGAYTEYELAELLAENTGLSVRMLPDSRICVHGRGTDITVKPESVFSWRQSANEQKYSSVTVTYGNDDTYIETDSTAYTGLSSSVKIYGTDRNSVFSDTDSLTLINRSVPETVTETVYFSAGEARLNKRPSAVLTDGVSYSGRTLYREGAYGYVSVSYETVYDEYAVVSSSAGKKAVTVSTDNSVTVITGKMGSSKTLSVPGITDRVSAMRKAKSLLTPANTAVITTSRNRALTLPAGIIIKCPYARGRAVSARINITADPLIITDTLEVTS